MTVDASLLGAWFSGWALARGVNPPIAEAEGWRIEVGWPRQQRRHLFAHAGAALRNAATAITKPFIYLKCCIPAAHMRDLMPAHWTVDPEAAFMTTASLKPIVAMSMDSANHPLPDGLQCRIEQDGVVWTVRILDVAGRSCASGHIVHSQGWAVFDRITTDVDWRGRGLATHIIQNLSRIAVHGGARGGLLVATTAGEPLYRRLGWQRLTPYASAFIDEDPQPASNRTVAPHMTARR